MDNENKENQQEQTPQEHFGDQMDKILSEKGEAKSDNNKSEDLDTSQEDDMLSDNESGKTSDDDEDLLQSDDEQEQLDQTDDDDYEIDKDVLEIFSEYGLTEETVKQMAKESPELLKSIKDELEQEESKSKPKPKQKQPPASQKSKFEEITVDLDPDLVGADVKSAIDSIVAKINQQGKDLQYEQDQLQKERQSSFQTKIDGYFDRFSKQVPDLGNSSTINERQYKTRLEIFRHAIVTSEIRDIPIEKAIQIEVNKHKNQDGEKVAAKKLIDKLEGQKKHFTNPPTRRHSDLSTRKFASEEERKEAVMAEGYRQAGIEE